MNKRKSYDAPRDVRVDSNSQLTLSLPNSHPFSHSATSLLVRDLDNFRHKNTSQKSTSNIILKCLELLAAQEGQRARTLRAAEHLLYRGPSIVVTGLYGARRSQDLVDRWQEVALPLLFCSVVAFLTKPWACQALNQAGLALPPYASAVEHDMARHAPDPP